MKLNRIRYHAPLLALALAIGGFFLLSLKCADGARQAARSEQIVRQCYNELGNLDHVVPLLHSIETSKHNFLLTGSEIYLAPYEQSRAELLDILKQLGQFSNLQSSERNEIAQLQTLSRAKMATIDALLGNPLQDGDEATQQLALESDRSTLPKILTAIRKLHEHTQNQLTTQLRQSHAAFNKLQTNLILTAVASLVCIVLASLATGHIVKNIFGHERKLAETAATRRTLDLLAKHSGSAAIITDAQGQIEWVNDGFTDLTGYVLSEVAGKKPGAMLQGPKSDLETIALMHSRLTSGEPFSVDMVNYDKAGHEYEVQIDVLPIFNAQEQLVNFVALERDITERREQEQELLEQVAELQQVVRTKGNLLTDASQAIRTPLAEIVGHANRLISLDLAGADQHTELLAIQREGEHLLHLTSGIADVADLASDKKPAEKVLCSPSQILADVVSVMEAKATSKGLFFSVVCETPIPEQILSVPVQLRQILMLLIDNSLHCTLQGGVRVICRMATRTDIQRPLLAFDVIDNGIHAPLQSPGLDVGSVSAAASRRFRDSQLGLAICRRLADALGATVECELEPAVGSVFTLLIETGSLSGVAMLENISAGNRIDGERSNSMSKYPQALAGRRILLVEDGIDARHSLTRCLTAAGAEVEAINRGRQATETVFSALEQGRAFDLVLMDMQLPEGDGYVGTFKLRQSAYEGPILGLVDHGGSSDCSDYLLIGCDQCVTLPMEPQPFVQSIAALIQRHQQFVVF